jgi:16S rRNA (cytidine1402-2'-O)-methyltransferase
MGEPSSGFRNPRPRTALQNGESESKDPVKSKVRNGKSGTLYVVSTPIGNLEDITLRALRVLKNVALIAAENVAHTKGLCRHYGIKIRLTRYHQHNQITKTRSLLKMLKSGQDLALVTDAGTPGISDPGEYLIRQAVKEGIAVVPVPGASAVTAALSVSGLSTDRFVFIGFLPNKSGKRKNELEKLVQEPRTMVFFEAPHRLKAMLTDLREILGDRRMVLVKELTKVFEEITRGSVSRILKDLTPDRIRGEFTLVVAGSEKKRAHGTDQQVLKRMEAMLAEGKRSIKDIAAILSSEEGLTYRKVYKECLVRKKALGISSHGVVQENQNQQ